MSDINASIHDYIADPTASGDVRGRGLVSFLLNHVRELSSSGKVEWSDNLDNTLLTFSGQSNIGLSVCYNSSNVYIRLACRHENSEKAKYWGQCGASSYQYTINLSSNNLGYRLISRSVGNLTCHSICTINQNGSTGDTLCTFMSFSIVDHLTSESIEALYIQGTFFGYSDYVKDGSPLDVSSVGGDKYPDGEHIVVAPVIFGAKDYQIYGYAESPTTLYRIYAGNQLMSVGLSAPVKINGIKFQQIIKGYFVRLG